MSQGDDEEQNLLPLGSRSHAKQRVSRLLIPEEETKLSHFTYKPTAHLVWAIFKFCKDSW